MLIVSYSSHTDGTWKRSVHEEAPFLEGLRLSIACGTFLIHLPKAEVLHRVETALGRNPLDWLTPGPDIWKLDLSALRRRLEPEHELTWLHGTIGLRPEVTRQDRGLAPFSAHAALVQFYLPRQSGRIFVVHGRDEATRHNVARLLERLDLDPVILHEQPDKARTIIEKFEVYADVSFAVVLLTGDDVGGLADLCRDNLVKRARQNVIFELGYFVARLGRERVCALRQEDVEMPSDYAGILYITLDSGGAWKVQLAKELQAAGLPVDLNRI